MGSTEGGPTIRLIGSDEADPRVRLVPGRRYEVSVVAVVDSDLQAIDDEVGDSGIRPPRLCGSRSTCLAVIETD